MLGDTLSDAQTMVDTLAELRKHWSTRWLTQAEVEAETLGDKLSDAQSLVDTLDDSLAQVEAETLGDTLSDAQAMVDTLGTEVVGDTLVASQPCQPLPAYRSVCHLASLPPPLLASQPASRPVLSECG